MAVTDTDACWRERDAPGTHRDWRPPPGTLARSATRIHRRNGTLAWPGTPLYWRHGPDTIALVIGERVVPVSDAVAVLLVRNPRHTLSDNPALDVLLTEQDLRWHAALLAGHLVDADRDIGQARAEIAAAHEERGWAKRRSPGASPVRAWPTRPPPTTHWPPAGRGRGRAYGAAVLRDHRGDTRGVARPRLPIVGNAAQHRRSG